MKLEIRGLDVWGNADDGYEVNDRYGVQATIDVPKDATDAQLIQALIDADIIYPGAYAFDDFSGDRLHGNVIDPKDGRPIVELTSVADEPPDSDADNVDPYDAKENSK